MKVLMGDDNTSDKTAQLIVERVRED
jgi:hypothetical protein